MLSTRSSMLEGQHARLGTVAGLNARPAVLAVLGFALFGIIPFHTTTATTRVHGGVSGTMWKNGQLYTRTHSVKDIERNVKYDTADLQTWTQTVALGDTAVLYCSFDAILSQVGHGMIDWVKNPEKSPNRAKLVAHGSTIQVKDKRYRVFMPHRSALSVLIIRKVKKRDAGRYRCHLSRNSNKHRIITLNVTESQLNVVHSETEVITKPGVDITLWCNGTGVPQPMVYWKRMDRGRDRRESKTNELWGSGLTLHRPTRDDTGMYACFLDNYVQPVQSYKFRVMVEEKQWQLKGNKMRFDSTKWHDHMDPEPKPLLGKSYLLMCETDGEPKPLPKIIWLRNGHRIRQNRKFYIIDDRPTWRPGYASSTLVIMKFQARLRGEYACQAANLYGVKRKDYTLTEYEIGGRRRKSGITTASPQEEITAAPHGDDEDYTSNEEGSSDVTSHNTTSVPAG